MQDSAYNNLKSFPEFDEWFASRKYIRPGDGGVILVWEIANLLSSFESPSPDDIGKLLLRFCREVQQPQQAYLEAEILFDSLSFDFTAYLNHFAEMAIIENKANLLDEAILFAAQETELLTLYFLSAWVAFNLGHMDDCIDRCDQVDTATNQILTLQGQALLEKGFPEDAIRIFEGAMDIDPNEVLTAFQACKAYLLIDDYDNAWSTIEKCDRLAPFNPEIAAFAAMIALEAPKNNFKMLTKSWELLDSHLDNYRGNPTIVTSLIQLTLKLKDKQKLRAALPRCDWDGLYQEPDFLKQLGSILHSLGALGWHEHAAHILDTNAICRMRSA